LENTGIRLLTYQDSKEYLIVLETEVEADTLIGQMKKVSVEEDKDLHQHELGKFTALWK